MSLSDIEVDGVESGGDVLGGGGLIETDVYSGKIKLAYLGKSPSSKAQSVTLHIETPKGEVRETLYFTNRDNKPHYEKNGKKLFLPGYDTVNDICLLVTKRGIVKQADHLETKTVKLYDFKEKEERPREVEVLTDLIGEDVSVAIQKQIVDKQAKVDGKYQKTGDTREENTISKFFNPDTDQTVLEMRNEIEGGVFKEAWLKKNQGKTANRAKGVKGGGKSGAPGASAEKPKKSLFDEE